MTLLPGEGDAALIIALQVYDVIRAVKYDLKSDGRGGQKFGPSLKPLDGKDFIVAVRFIGKGNGGVVRCEGKQRYFLTSGLAGLVLKKL